MGVTRRYVLPIIRLVLLGVIAVALLQLAFGRGGSNRAAGPPLEPSVTVQTPQVPVMLGSIDNTVTIPATITADPDVPVKATAEGKVSKFLTAPGTVVATGQPLLEVVAEEPGSPKRQTGPDGVVTEIPGEPVKRYRTVKAPADGTVAEYSVLVGQSVSIGTIVGAVVPAGYSVTGTVSAQQQYRLLAAPSSAQVTIQGGPAPFACTDLHVGRAARATGQDSGDAESSTIPGGAIGSGSSPGGSSGGTAISCRVPPAVTVFDGLTATMAVAAGRAEGALVVPVTAVRGSFQAGTVWVVRPDGTPQERPVTLGLTDGEQVQVTSGVTEGEQILQFVPVPDDEAARSGPAYVGQ